MEIPKVIALKKDNITDFAKERNNLLQNVKSNWVLFLDRDEKLSNHELRIRNDADALYLTRRNFFLGKYVGSDKIIRLAKKNVGIWKRRVHERWIINGKVGEIKNPVIIHNTANNLNHYINKINYYSGLHALANKEEGKKSNLFKIILYPVAKFVVTLTKSENVVFSIMQAFHSFLSWSKLYFLGS